MADDTEDQPVTPVAPPPQVPVPRGTGYTYSTPGPANWTQPQTVAGPGGPVQIPQNAQNFTSIIGPPPEDQETAAFRKMFNSLPMDQAIKAYQSAKQFQVSRIAQNQLQQDLANGVPYQEAYTKFMMRGAAGGLFSTPKEMTDLQKNLASASSQKFQQDLATQKLAQEKALKEEGFKNALAVANVRASQSQEGKLTQQNREALKNLDAEEKELRKDLGRTAYWKPYRLTPEGKAEYSTKTNRLAQIVAKKQMLAPEPKLPTETTAAPAQKPLDRATAAKFLKDAKGDKAKARQMARDAGYTF